MPRQKKNPVICPFTATFEQDFRNFLATDITVFGDRARDYCLWSGVSETPSPEGKLFMQKAPLPGPYVIPASHWLWDSMKTQRRVKPMQKPLTNMMIDMAPSQTRSIRYGRDYHAKDQSLASFMDWVDQLLRPQAVDNAPAVHVEADFDAIIIALVNEIIDTVVQAAEIPPPVIAPVVEVEAMPVAINLDDYLEDEAIEDVVADVQDEDVPFDEDEEDVDMDIGQPDDIDQDEDVLVEEEVAENGNIELPVQQVAIAQPVEAPLAPEVVQPVQRRRQPPRKAKQTTRKAKPTPKKAPVKRRRRRAPIQPSRPAVRQYDHGDGFVAKLMADNTIRISGTIPGVNWKASTLFKAAHDGEVILRPPPRSRFTKVAAGASHIMMLTDKDQVMIVGSNKFGQLGTSLSRAKLTRAAAQTPATILRPLYGMAGKKVQRIEARNHESSVWVGGVQYCCGVASDHSWRSSVMKPIDELRQRMRLELQGQ